MKLVFALCSVLCWSYVGGLQCNYGGVLHQSPIFGNIYNFTTKSCGKDEVCLTGKGTFDNKLMGNVFFGMCANKSDCKAPCKQLAHFLSLYFNSTSMITTDVTKRSQSNFYYNMTSCEASCCNQSMCNTLPGKEMMNTTPAPTTTPAPLTTVPPTTMGADSVIVRKNFVFLMFFVSLFTAFVIC